MLWKMKWLGLEGNWRR